MRVILVRLSALGDVVHTWPLAVAMAAGIPDLHLTWVVEEPLVPLVDRHPAVDAVIAVATRRWRRRPFSPRTRAEVAVVRSRLRELNADACVDAQGLVKSALVTRWTAAPDRVGFARPWRREVLAGWAYTRTVAGSRVEPHVVASNLELVRAFGLEPPRPTPDPDGGWLLEAVPGPGAAPPEPPYGVLLPGAGRPDKVLPIAVLARAATHLARRGVVPVVGWGPGERERAEGVVRAAGEPAELAPPTDIRELAALLARSAVVLGADTGPVHLAASLGVPTVAVHLTTSPERNGPRGARVAVVSAVAPHRGGPSGAARAPSAGPVEPERVLAALDALLEPAPGPRRDRP